MPVEESPLPFDRYVHPIRRAPFDPGQIRDGSSHRASSIARPSGIYFPGNYDALSKPSLTDPEVILIRPVFSVLFDHFAEKFPVL